MEHVTVSLFGFDFFKGSLEEAVTAVSGWNPVNSRKEPLVLTPNTDIAVQIERLRKQLPAFVNRLEQSAFILPDGFPVLIAARLKKKPLPGVIAGADLLPELIRQTSQKRFLFVGPDQHTLGTLCDRIESNTDHAVRWVAPPMMRLESPVFIEQVDKAACLIEEFCPHFVVVGLGFPKQEYFSFAVIDQLGSFGSMPLFMGFGASAEFMAGTKKRAPRWMRSLYLEWLHRLLSEPRRMFRRYAVGGIRMIPMLIREWRRN